MLDEHDTAGVVALLIRAVRAQYDNVRDQKIVEEANARIAASNLTLNQARTALAVFGFELNKPDVNVWNEVRDAIGTERYNEAVEIGRRGPAVRMISDHSATFGAADAHDEEVSEAETTSTDGVIDDVAPPKISDAIVEFLALQGAHGAKVAEVKTYLSLMYGIETHEKTPGMTLYRLSQQNPPLARREGRTWFFVPPAVVESKNPGAGTPGSEEGSSE